MEFIRENLFKIIVVMGVIVVVIIAVASCSPKASIPTAEKYETMESDMVEAAQKFTDSHPKMLPKEVHTSKSVKLSLLVSNEQINELHAIEDKNVLCTGYVLIERINQKQNKFIPHLKCGKYYETKSLADYIIKHEKIADDEGLHDLGNGTYIYKGENPNNYVYFDEKYYRIISINRNKEVKLIALDVYDTNEWDDRYNTQYEETVGINNFEKSRLKDYLEEMYKDVDDWPTSLKSYIIPHDICIGKRSANDNGNITGSVECSAVSKDANLGIIQANEYLQASTDPACVSGSNPECANYNYFSNISTKMHTLNASADDSSKVYVVADGVLELEDASDEEDIFPVFYIDPNALYARGDGTQENPYMLR